MFELVYGLRSLDEWRASVRANPWLTNIDYIQRLALTIKSNGFIDPYYGFCAPDKVKIFGSNYRETLSALDLNSRHRAIVLLLMNIVLQSGSLLPALVSECVTPFADLMRRLLPNVLTVEHFVSDAAQRLHPNVMRFDPVNSELPAHAFDLYISTDAMMFSPDVSGVLSEARRILRPGGRFVATFPFNWTPETSVLAELLSDGSVYVREELFFRDRILDIDRRVWFVPGWDIVHKCMDAGFSGAEIVAVSSRRHAICGEETASVFVLHATA